ncbi:hypothetical protein [uncultured Bacteroides sp.]|uniref:hypothetical protein n=1 Tax=uncultured Bacteroides sp. TaxID=162156 RepID=UPI002AABD501|nr:hypothetical protein [uncultured Bacteroides sp.]
MHDIGPFSIPAMRSFVPEKLRPWIMVVFVIIFQLSGGVYLAAVNEIVGSTSLMQEDITMAGAASLVGLALVFTIMFRLKFRFPSKPTLLTCCIFIIACNLICMHTDSVPVLVATCFVAGVFRMWATFECNSTIQLWITPKRDLSIFFCYINLLVQGMLQFTGLTAIYTSYLSKWEYMHWIVVALLLLVMIATTILFRTYRSMKKLPLFGIDWLGALLWALTILSVIFLSVYGEHYDWYESQYIQIATVFAVVLLLINLWRAKTIRHPYISLHTWKFRTVYLTFFIYLVVFILISPMHVIEHAYMEHILGYDSLNLISTNWIAILGIATASIFMYRTFALKKWSYKRATVIGFSAIVAYLLIFYFMIDYNLPKEALILPIFLRNFGYLVISITFITALTRVPFQYFWEALTIQAFVDACFGEFFGAAVLGHAMKFVMAKNVMLLGANLDHVNVAANQMPMERLYGALQQQALIVSMKELLGWLLILGIFCLVAFMLKESSITPRLAVHPKFRTIRRYIKHELRERIN